MARGRKSKPLRARDLSRWRLIADLQERLAAKECNDCGYSGPDGKGVCPDEKGKSCHYSKK